MQKTDFLFYSILVVLVAMGALGFAACFFVESWWIRICIVLGTGFLIMMIFMASVFWLAPSADHASVRKSTGSP
jgi:hypothetical protein